jgi:hypothetical protein
MICSVCGSESPSDSRFCRMCGDSFLLGETDAARARRRLGANAQPGRVVAALAVAVLLLAGLGYYAYMTHRRASDRYAENFVDRLTKKPYTMPVASDELTINQLGYTYFKLDVPAKASSVVLHGNFTATGGENTIEAYVFSASGYVNWQNRHAANPFYSSGKVSMDTINASLPAGAGTYYLVFNNKFSVTAPKNVHVNAALNYYQ